MRHPEEELEDQIASMPRHERERAQPDGMNAPGDPCRHQRTKPLPGMLGQMMGYTICLDCGKVGPKP
jgi:hypothetical protein